MPQEGRIVSFRDGPRVVPDYLAKSITADAHPDLTFQEWVDKVANKEMERRIVNREFGLMRLLNFGQ